jgi:hypothetical protein
MPLGLSNGIATVVINNNGTVLRGFVTIASAQPDIFTSTNGPGGRAAVVNITNPNARTPEPFTVTTDVNGTATPTVLEVTLTGVRNVQASEVTVTIGTTAITGASILLVTPNREMPGFDIITFTLPGTLAGAGDVPIVISVAKSGVTSSSRPSDSAPHITIN